MDAFLERVLDFSQGNPGAIVAMVEMAKHPKYRTSDHIKVTPLCIDFRTGNRQVHDKSMKLVVMPKKLDFFMHFSQLAETVTEGARLLAQLLGAGTKLPARVEQLKGIEHRADDIAHEIFRQLNQTFITPFDREDTHRLASPLDDVLDLVWKAGQSLLMHRITSVPVASTQLGAIIVRQCEELEKAVSLLRKNHGVLDHCLEVSELNEKPTRYSNKCLAVF